MLPGEEDGCVCCLGFVVAARGSGRLLKGDLASSPDPVLERKTNKKKLVVSRVAAAALPRLIRWKLSRPRAPLAVAVVAIHRLLSSVPAHPRRSTPATTQARYLVEADPAHTLSSSRPTLSSPWASSQHARPPRRGAHWWRRASTDPRRSYLTGHGSPQAPPHSINEQSNGLKVQLQVSQTEPTNNCNLR
ncbi:hypothetical protein BRADI_2g25292v3 [Brachypodium distachyon]|uniref:Uncharacterized protein n=1 Tax=Brachypodium distachyon TaxID=15368 RepID=A0A2K2DAE5_BRADI|nr:hypothetical protein BRADI_2g25292v3 [Brachypodium distachyon]